MAEIIAPRVPMVFNEVSTSRKPLKCIDIFFFADGNAKCTFVRNIPVKDISGEITSWNKQSFYEVVSGLDKSVSMADIFYQDCKIVSSK